MTTNLYRALRELLPEPPLQVATVTSRNLTAGTSIVTWPGGETQVVRGTQVNVGLNAFVRNGLVEGAAPSLTPLVIDV